MMKKTTNYMLMAMLMLGIGGIVTSCNDDDLTEEEKRKQNSEEDEKQELLTSEFWQVMGQLSDVVALPENWENATFEPAIGLPSEKSTTTRIVLTNDAETAAQRFEYLTGVDVSNYNSYTWKRDFGTLTYEKTNDGTSWATVEVDIKQMPGLKRIVYCTSEQQGLNRNVEGTPYYRFGDVVKKKNADNVWEYWVCVRPMFGLEDKGDMHWMCLGNLPTSEIETFQYKGRQWWWQKSLTTNYEQMQNLAEMTYAIIHPNEWMDYYTANQNVKPFHDFRVRNIAYHNQYFWTKVQRAWNEALPEENNQTVFNLLFHRTLEEMQSSNSLSMFYGTAQGPKKTWAINVKTADYSGDNYRTVNWKNVSKSGETNEFDIREYSNFGRPDNSTLLNDANLLYVYPVRYASDKMLFGSKPGDYQSMDNGSNIIDVYVFNKYYEQPIGSKENMRIFDRGSIELRTFSYIQPGTVMEDAETGQKWICYAGWYDDGETNVGDHKVRFISFDDFGEKSETYSVNEETKDGKFNHRLIPEAEAPMAMAAIYMLAKTQDGHNDNAFREACKKYNTVKTEDFIIQFDTITAGKSKPRDYIYSFSLAYEPTGGRKSGTQPYLRMVADNSNNSFRSEQGNEYLQYLHYYFYKYYNEDGRRNVLLDLTHLFDAGEWIGDKPIKADRWSRCVVTSTNQRNGDFTKEKCGKGSYSSYLYAYKYNGWVFSKNGKSSQPKYTDAYFAPVLRASYMEIDDSKRLDQFTGNYNGRSYKLLSYPESQQIYATMALPFALKSSFNTLSYLDEAPFDPIH